MSIWEPVPEEVRQDKFGRNTAGLRHLEHSQVAMSKEGKRWSPELGRDAGDVWRGQETGLGVPLRRKERENRAEAPGVFGPANKQEHPPRPMSSTFRHFRASPESAEAFRYQSAG